MMETVRVVDSKSTQASLLNLEARAATKRPGSPSLKIRKDKRTKSRPCAYCGEPTWCFHYPKCPPVVGCKGDVHPVSQPCKVVCPECLTYPEDRRVPVESLAKIAVRVLKPKETHPIVRPPAIGWQCQNPKHQRVVKYKGKKTGTKGIVHFKHDWDVCPDCDNRIVDAHGTRVIYLPWPPFWTEESLFSEQFNGHVYEMPCLTCGGGGKIW